MKTKEAILYDVSGLLYTEHPKVIEAMDEYAKEYHAEQFVIEGVDIRKALLIGFVKYSEKMMSEHGTGSADLYIDDFLKGN